MSYARLYARLEQLLGGHFGYDGGQEQGGARARARARARGGSCGPARSRVVETEAAGVRLVNSNDDDGDASSSSRLISPTSPNPHHLLSTHQIAFSRSLFEEPILQS